MNILNEETISEKTFTGERALFNVSRKTIVDCIFGEGESPLKESSHLTIRNCQFEWKYPLWYSHNIVVYNSIFNAMARAGIWYTDHISMKDCVVLAPKEFRRCKNMSLENVNFADAKETLWSCQHIDLKNVQVANGDYFAMNCSDMEIEKLSLCGNYAFDGAKNVVIRNSKLLTKDAFWNAENITVYDSVITGEYFGWNSRNIKLVNCTIESLQGFCYMDNIILENCKLLNTTLAFEYSSNINADVLTNIDSVANPISGLITCHGIKELINNEFHKGNNDNVEIIETGK